MGNDVPEQGLDESQLSQVIAQLQSDEQISIESTLESEVSFTNWLNGHPAMRQMLLPEKLTDVVPVILKFLRYMLGIDREPPELKGVTVPEGSPAEEDGTP